MYTTDSFIDAEVAYRQARVRWDWSPTRPSRHRLRRRGADAVEGR